jgi:two-component system C4-dicarboxylate transport response regulator DctD
MTSSLPTVALVDDDDDLRAATAQLLGLAGYRVLGFADGFGAAQAIGEDFDGIVISDVRMSHMSGWNCSICYSSATAICRCC